jgi:hypothetical protein
MSLSKDKETEMSNSEFVALLAKYDMTFHWGAINKNWRINGHAEHGCNRDTLPAPAENYNAAQVAAQFYIQRRYKLPQVEILPSTQAIDQISLLSSATEID